MNKTCKHWLSSLLMATTCFVIVFSLKAYGQTSLDTLNKESCKGNQQAIETMKELATQGNDTAQLILGKWYEYGENVLQNYDTAFLWYQKSADQYLTEALRNLSLMFYKGQGTKKDIVQSYFLFKIAGILDNNMERIVGKIIESKMNADQIGQANKLCEEWLKTHKNILSSLNHSSSQDTLALSIIANSKDSTRTGRSRKNIMATVSKNLKYIRYAYNKRLQDKSGIEGTILTKFIIDEFGKVVFCRVIIANTNDQKLESAVVDIIKHWKFDKIDKPDDITEIIYPFKFSQ